MYVSCKNNIAGTIKIIIIVLFSIYITSPRLVFSMNFLSKKSQLSSEWRERFSDVNQLNKYVKDHLFDIKNSLIQEQNIDGAVINGGKFENDDFNKVSMKNSKLKGLVFHGGTIEHLDLSGSELTNVVFDSVKLRGVLFYGATLKNVKFVNSTFNGVAIDQTKNSQIEIIDSKAISSSFSEGELSINFRNCELFDGVDITDLKYPSSLKFDKSKLSKVNMERAHLKDLVINGTEFDSIFDVGSADNIVVKNSVLDASFSATMIGKLSISDTKIKNLSVLRAKVDSAKLSNCNDMHNFGMFQSKVGFIQFEHCVINDFRPIDSEIGELIVKDSTITNSSFEDMNAKKADFNAVVLSGDVNFKNAKINDFKSNGITKKGGVKLNTDGSNIDL